MRTSTRFDRPTVSIQNGRPTCRPISWLRTRSSEEKNGFGPGEGSGSGGRKAAESPKRSVAILVMRSPSPGASAIMSTIAAMSPAVEAERRSVVSCQFRSMNTNATSDWRMTTGAMMIISERA